MSRSAFSRRRFLQLSGGLALAGVSLPLWAHDMAEMASGDAPVVSRQAIFYR